MNFSGVKRIVLLLLFAVLFKHCNGKHKYLEDGQSYKRSSQTETQNASSQLGNQPTIKIEGAQNCNLTRASTSGCSSTYTSGKLFQYCTLPEVFKQILPDVDLKGLTKSFIKPEKFFLMKITIDNCGIGEKAIDIISKESQETACGYLRTESSSSYTVTWKSSATNFTNVKISGKGYVTLGYAKNAILFSKVYDEETVNITIETRNYDLRVKDFAQKFNIDMKEVIPDSIKAVQLKLDPSTLTLQQPQIAGVIFPGEAFEIYASGRVTNPGIFLKAETKLIAQYFEETENQGESKRSVSPISPTFAMVFFFDRGNDRDFISAVKTIADIRMPKLNWIINGMQGFAFTVANEDLFMVYNEELKEAVNKYLTDADQQAGYKGATFRFTQNIIDDIRKIQAEEPVNIPERISTIASVKANSITFTTVELVQLTLKQLNFLAWPPRKEMLKYVWNITKEPNRVNLNYLKFSVEGNKNTFTVSGNQTNSLSVIPYLFNIQNSEISFTTESEGYFNYSPWIFNATGENMFLGEKANITIYQDDKKTYFCRGKSGMFSLEEVTKKTKTQLLKRKQEVMYNAILQLSLKDLYYVASFDRRDQVLRIKGHAVMKECKDNKVEILYWVVGNPNLAFGLVCSNSRLDEVINTISDTTILSQTWMTFDRIGIVVKKAKRSIYKFSDELLEQINIDKGIRLITEGLQLDNVLKNDTYVSMADLFKTQYGNKMDLKYIGSLGGSQGRPSMAIRASIPKGLCLNSKLPMKNLESEIKAIKQGEFARLKGDIFFQGINFVVKGQISIDASGTLQLLIKPDNLPLDNLLPLSYFQITALHARMVYPHHACPNYVDLDSAMGIGSSSGNLLTFNKKNTEQHIDFEDSQKSTFYGVKQNSEGIPLDDLLKAFGIRGRLNFLRNARCLREIVVGYSGGNNDLWIPEFNKTVVKGLHFMCMLEAFGREQFTICSYLDSQMMSCKIYLTQPLNISKGFFYMAASLEHFNFPPAIIARFSKYTADATLQGYTSTVGISAKCKFDITDGGDGMIFTTTIQGNIFREVQASMTLTGVGNSPYAMDIQIDMDLTTQLSEGVKKNLLTIIKKNWEILSSPIKNNKKRAKYYGKKYSEHTTVITILQDEVEFLIRNITKINKNIQFSTFELSSDCIDSATSVDMPGLVVDEACEKENNGQTSLCLKWSPEKTKAIKVSDLVKCEAKKIRTFQAVKNDRKNIRILINNVIQKKGRIESEQRIAKILEEMESFSSSILKFLDEKTSVLADLESILNNPWKQRTYFSLQGLRTTVNINDISPPVLPYQVKWSADGKTYAEPLNLTHNYPFVESLGGQIFKNSFPAFEEAQNAAEEASFRIAEIKRVEDSLTKAREKVNDEKRFNVPNAQAENILGNHSYLLEYGDPIIPHFTVRSDMTTFGFHMHSPWVMLKHAGEMPYVDHTTAVTRSNITFEKDGDCGKVRSIIETYSNFANDINTLGTNYLDGKSSLNNIKTQLWTNYNNARDDISKYATEIKAGKNDIRSMTYWLHYTKEGLDDFENEVNRQLGEHNAHIFRLYQKEQNQAFADSGVGGVNNYLDYLGTTGKASYKRGMIDHSQMDQGLQSLSDISETFTKIMTDPSATIEQVMPQANRMKSQLEFLRSHVTSCQQ